MSFCVCKNLKLYKHLLHVCKISSTSFCIWTISKQWFIIYVWFCVGSPLHGRVVHGQYKPKPVVTWYILVWPLAGLALFIQLYRVVGFVNKFLHSYGTYSTFCVLCHPFLYRICQHVPGWVGVYNVWHTSWRHERMHLYVCLSETTQHDSCDSMLTVA